MWTTRKLVFLTVAVLIAMAELDRLVGEALSFDGQVSRIADVTGFSAVTHLESWAGWATAAPPPWLLIFIHIALDLVFIWAYRTLLLGFTPVLGVAADWQKRVRWVVIADVVEDAVLALSAIVLIWGAHASFLAWSVAAFATLKWIAVGSLVFWLLRHEGATLWSWLSLRIRLLWVHRAAAVVIGALAIVSLLPRAEILEQLPDIQRSWFLWDGPGEPVGFEGQLLIFAVLLGGILWFAIFLMGRIRSTLFNSVMGGPRLFPDPRVYILWFSVPLAALIVGAALAIAGGIQRQDIWAFVDPIPFGIFVGVAVAIPLVSALRVQRPSSQVPPPPDRPAFPLQHTDGAAVTGMGDAIAATAIGISALSLVRSFTAPALLGLPISSVSPEPELLAIAAWSAVLAIAGAVTAVFSGPIANGLRNFLVPPGAAGPVAAALTPATPMQPWEPFARFAGGLAAVLWMLALVVAPLWMTSHIDIVTIVVVTMLAWAFIVTVVDTRMQEYRPIEVFRPLGLRSAPLVTLFLVVPFVIAQFGGSPMLHRIQTGTIAAANLADNQAALSDPISGDDRLDLGTAFTEWADAPGCLVNEASSEPYRPLVLVAAQGGGIRAATWTVDVLRAYASSSACAGGAVFASSGASGGSVGLTMFRGTSGTTSEVSAQTLGNPRALAAGMAGTLVNDVIASTTGLRIPSVPGYLLPADKQWVWQDRAALIQAAWAESVPQFSHRFDLNRESPTGWLLLNGTAAGSGCRAVFSQLDLGIHAAYSEVDGESDLARCSTDTPGVSATIDVLGYCDLDIDWATAAMMSSRFPVVTPAGRITDIADGSRDCKSVSNLLLADGGYSENSGLGTLSDLAPELVHLIAEHNADRGGGPPIIPFLLFARNESGTDVSAPTLKPGSELTVPLLAKGVREALITDNAWLQRLSNALSEVCDTGDTDCRAALNSAHDAVDGGVAVVAPTTRPALIAPLGWTLSALSQYELQGDVDRQVEAAACSTGRDLNFGRLTDLLHVVSDTPPDCPVPE